MPRELTTEEINVRADDIRESLRDLSESDAIMVLIGAAAAEIAYAGQEDTMELHTELLRRFVADNVANRRRIGS